MDSPWRNLILLFFLIYYQRRSQYHSIVVALSSSSSSTTPNTKNNENLNDNTSGWKATPCNRICRYNANVYDGKVCIGCFRDTYEISHWDKMTPQERSNALDDAADRLTEQLSSMLLPSLSPMNDDDEADNDDDNKNNKNNAGRRWYGSVSVTELNQQALQWRTLDGH
jgi:predicted Fe-S protein YdhL (DUF1289 family)